MAHPFHLLAEARPDSLSDADRIAMIAILNLSTSTYSGETLEGIYDTLLADYHRWQRETKSFT